MHQPPIVSALQREGFHFLTSKGAFGPNPDASSVYALSLKTPSAHFVPHFFILTSELTDRDKGLISGSTMGNFVCACPGDGENPAQFIVVREVNADKTFQQSVKNAASLSERYKIFKNNINGISIDYIVIFDLTSVAFDQKKFLKTLYPSLKDQGYSKFRVFYKNDSQTQLSGVYTTADAEKAHKDGQTSIMGYARPGVSSFASVSSSSSSSSSAARPAAKPAAKKTPGRPSSQSSSQSSSSGAMDRFVMKKRPVDKSPAPLMPPAKQESDLSQEVFYEERVFSPPVRRDERDILLVPAIPPDAEPKRICRGGSIDLGGSSESSSPANQLNAQSPALYSSGHEVSQLHALQQAVVLPQLPCAVSSSSSSLSSSYIPNQQMSSLSAANPVQAVVSAPRFSAMDEDSDPDDLTDPDEGQPSQLDPDYESCVIEYDELLTKSLAYINADHVYKAFKQGSLVSNRIIARREFLPSELQRLETYFNNLIRDLKNLIRRVNGMYPHKEIVELRQDLNHDLSKTTASLDNLRKLQKDYLFGQYMAPSADRYLSANTHLILEAFCASLPNVEQGSLREWYKENHFSVLSSIADHCYQTNTPILMNGNTSYIPSIARYLTFYWVMTDPLGQARLSDVKENIEIPETIQKMVSDLVGDVVKDKGLILHGLVNAYSDLSEQQSPSCRTNALKRHLLPLRDSTAPLTMRV